jgi:3-dehydroquinate synthase
MEDGAYLNLSNLKVVSSKSEYRIEFGDISKLLLAEIQFVLADSKLNLGVIRNPKKIIYVEAIEKHKTLSTCEQIIIQFSKLGLKRGDSIAVVGGGYVQDIGTLISSLYMRGIDWYYYPTTLAAMGDSCIGGKSSINAGPVKNLLGNFYPPSAVGIDVLFVSSLPQIELVAGLSEIIKICYAHSEQNFDQSLALARSANLQSDSAKLQEIIHLSLFSKKYFVEEDEFDMGIRKLLNFGHTFGHAVESASDMSIPHGVAVLIGMLAAIEHPLSVQSERTTALMQICHELLSTVEEIFTDTSSRINFEVFKKAIAMDKKNTETNLNLVLPSKSKLSVISDSFASGAVDRAVTSVESALRRAVNEIR